jgi:spore coat polysaccharide biosynthesis protein SpsF
MQAKKIIFRCDGGYVIGLGHLKRCLSLAYEFKFYHDAQVVFAMRGDESAIEMVRNEGYDVITNLSSTEFDLYNCFVRMKPDAIFFDVRDQTTRSELDAIKKLGIKIVVLDDSSDRRLAADYVFYPPVPQIEKLNWSEFRGEKYVGWEWVFLSKVFYDQEKLINSKKYLNKKLLITMGGVDPLDLSYQIFTLLKGVKFEGQIIFVLGSGYQGRVNEEILKDYENFKLVRAPESMMKIMLQVSFAISAFGITAYELGLMRIPSLLICNSVDDRMSAEIFRKESMAKILNSQSLNSSVFEKGFKCLMNLKFPEDKKFNIGNGLKKIYDILWH